MTLTLEIAPEKEAILRVKAAQRGQSLNDYVRAVVEQDAEQEAPAVPVVFSQDRQARNAQIRALLYAPAAVRAATLSAGQKALAADYAHNSELSEFTSALQHEDFHDAD